MGRIKTTLLKSRTKEILEKHGDKFTTEFNKNKEAVNETIDVSSKKLRNIMAGYATRLKKSGKY